MAKQERTRARAVLLIAGLLLVTVIGGVLVGGSASASHRADPYITRTKTVHPRTLTSPPPPFICCDDPVMPVTGADITLFGVTGIAAIATGAVLVRRTRARREQTDKA